MTIKSKGLACTTVLIFAVVTQTTLNLKAQSHSMADNSNQARIATTLNIFQNAIRYGDLNSLLTVANHGANVGPSDGVDSSFHNALISFYEQFNLDSLNLVENPVDIIDAFQNFNLSVDSCQINDDQASIQISFNWPSTGAAKETEDHAWLDMSLNGNKWYFTDHSQLLEILENYFGTERTLGSSESRNFSSRKGKPKSAQISTAYVAEHLLNDVNWWSDPVVPEINRSVSSSLVGPIPCGSDSPGSRNHVGSDLRTEAGDADCNGTLSITDGVHMINWIYGGGPPPGQTCDCSDY